MVLYTSQGIKAVEGLTLKLPGHSAQRFSTKAFENMKKLRLLQLSGTQLDGDCIYLSKQLRWVHWNGFPLECIPANFYQRNLVSIELQNSNVKLVWKEMQVLVECNFFVFSELLYHFLNFMHKMYISILAEDGEAENSQS